MSIFGPEIHTVAAGELDMGNNQVIGVANPTESQDAATKAYVDTTRVKPLITIWAKRRGAN